MAEKQKTILITGGSDGLGLLAAKKMVEKGWRVVITGRDKAKMDKAVANIVEETGKPSTNISYLVMDLTSLPSVRGAANDFLALGTSLDVLLLNAASIHTSLKLDPSGTWELTMFCAFVGHVLFADLLLERVKSTPGARILIVSSEVHNPQVKTPGKPVKLDIGNLDGHKEWDSQVFYKNAKLLNLYHAYSLARTLNKDGITVNAFCPGWVPNTSLAREHGSFMRFLAKKLLPFMMTPIPVEVAADNYVWYATSEELGKSTGGFYKHKEKLESTPESHDEAKADLFLKKAWETINSTK